MTCKTLDVVRYNHCRRVCMKQKRVPIGKEHVQQTWTDKPDVPAEKLASQIVFQ